MLQFRELDEKINQLEVDLTQALEISNKADEERLLLQEQKQELLSKLKETIRIMVKLEGQLRSLSASTLSMSSSSSLGSLSTSSKGSLSSLSFSDIYGSQQYSSSEHVAPNMSDLHRRVERLLKSNYESDRQYAEKMKCLEESSGGVLSQSMLSLSPRSSLSSLSPPTSSCEPLLGLDFPTKYAAGDVASTEGVDLASVQEQLAELCLMSENSEATLSSGHGTQSGENLVSPLSHNKQVKDLSEYELNLLSTRQGGVSRLVAGLIGAGSAESDVLYEMGEEEEERGCDVEVEEKHRTISAAVSDESVAGDSGVYEACTKSSNSPECPETPQVQIKLK